MPVYDWSCSKCEHVTSIVRKMSEYELGPEKCEKCECTELVRTVPKMGKSQVILVHGGRAPWFAETITSSGKPNGR